MGLGEPADFGSPGKGDEFIQPWLIDVIRLVAAGHQASEALGSYAALCVLQWFVDASIIWLLMSAVGL